MFHIYIYVSLSTTKTFKTLLYFFLLTLFLKKSLITTFSFSNQRPDSIPTLKTINVPTLIITGDEDVLAGVPEAELMKQSIVGSEMKIIPKAGHFSPWERPEEVGELLRKFLDSVRHA